MTVSVGVNGIYHATSISGLKSIKKIELAKNKGFLSAFWVFACGTGLFHYRTENSSEAEFARVRCPGGADALRGLLLSAAMGTRPHAIEARRSARSTFQFSCYKRIPLSQTSQISTAQYFYYYCEYSEFYRTTE
jgi:hypothetical protein